MGYENSLRYTSGAGARNQGQPVTKKAYPPGRQGDFSSVLLFMLGCVGGRV